MILTIGVMAELRVMLMVDLGSVVELSMGVVVRVRARVRVRVKNVGSG